MSLRRSAPDRGAVGRVAPYFLWKAKDSLESMGDAYFRCMHVLYLAFLRIGSPSERAWEMANSISRS